MGLLKKLAALARRAFGAYQNLTPEEKKRLAENAKKLSERVLKNARH